MKRYLLALAAVLASSGAATANYGYCFTQGLMGGTKVFLHDHVHEAEFWDGKTVDTYRNLLQAAERFRFGTLTCPGFDSETEARDSLTKLRKTFLDNGFADFPFPARRAE